MQPRLVTSWLQLLSYKVNTVTAEVCTVAIAITYVSVGDVSQIYHFNNNNYENNNNNNSNNNNYSYITPLSIPWSIYVINYNIFIKMRFNSICNALMPEYVI